MVLRDHSTLTVESDQSTEQVLYTGSYREKEEFPAYTTEKHNFFKQVT